MRTSHRSASSPTPDGPPLTKPQQDRSAQFEQIAAECRAVLDTRFQARERGIADSRKAIRAAANAIRHLHRGQHDEADALIDESNDLLRDAESLLADHTDTLNANFFVDAVKEYAEAVLTRAVFDGRPLPTPEELDVDPVPYLHGLGETVGECRRRLLDLLRHGDLAAAESMLVTMDEIVDLLADLDYPDGMTNGLRRTTDVSRALVERSRSDLTATVVQERLRRDLASG